MNFDNVDTVLKSTQQLEDRLQKLETAYQNQFTDSPQRLVKLEVEVDRLSRDLMSARADSMRTEGRVVRAVGEVGSIKEELSKIGMS